MQLAVTLIVSLLNVFLGYVAYVKNPKGTTNRLLTFLTIQLSSWAIANYFSLNSNTEVSTLFWIRAVMLVTSPLGPTLYLLSLSFPERKIRLPKWSVVAIWTISLVTAALSFTPFMFVSVKINDGVISPTPGPAIALYALTFLGGLVAAFITIIYKYFKLKGLEKVQIKILLIGMILTFTLLGFTNFIFVVFLKISSFVFAGPLLTVIFVSGVTYTIIKHRFLDIRLIIVRALTYTLLTFFIALGYLALLFNLAFFMGEAKPTLATLQQFITPTFLAIFFVFTFQPLRKLFEKFTNKFFFKDKYDSNQVLWELNRSMASTLSLSELTQHILKKMLSSIKISYGSIVLVRNQSVIWVDSAGNVRNKNFNGRDIFTIIHESYKPKSRDEQIVIFEELSERKKDLKNIMREHNITVVLPLVVRKQLIGGLILGEKHSGEIYSSDDIDLLKIVAPEVGIAVRNALSFEEIKHFNITLEEEVRYATARLKKTNIRLKELDSLKDEFVSIASHELRTPMTAIKSYLWMALNQSDQKIKEPLKKYLDISYNSTERLIRLVNDMLTVSRIERNKIEINKESVDITEIVQLVFDELKISADEKHITFTFTKEEKKKYMAKGDREKLREVFQNLIGNALKFTPEKGSITVHIGNSGKMVTLSVTDTGSGIRKEEQRKLFKKFSKIEYSYSKHSSQPGTGLGLYISKQIISLHNGTIEVQSDIDKGSTFTVLLPEILS